MRKLFLCEISHHISDITPEVLAAVRDEIGNKQFKQLQKKSDEFWCRLEKEIEKKKFNYKKLRIYQDGWPGVEPYKKKIKEIYDSIRSQASSEKEALDMLKEKDKKEGRNSQLMMGYLRGKISEKKATMGIIKRIAASDSKNYKLLKKLLQKGATLEASEDYNLVKEERNYILKIKDAKSDKDKASAKKRYEKRKNSLLKKRDRYFADRINKTVHEGESGLVFIGKKHNILPFLDGNIIVKETR